MFFMGIATFMPPYMMTNLTFQVERPVFLREQANKMYDVLPYYMAKLLSDVPGFLIVPTIYTLIVYWAVGYTRSVEQFFSFALMSILNTLCALSLGYFISSSIPSPVAALQLAPIIAMPLILVGGMYINQDSMPIYIEVFSYCSPVQYVFNAYAKIEFENSEYPQAK